MTYAIEPSSVTSEWVVMDYDDDALDRTVVFAGTQAECERYVREHEREE